MLRTMLLHLRISGRVQGVFYRASARDKALSLGLRGWVRNRRDGSVELVAAGDDEALARLAAWCERGPPSARVDIVERVVESVDSDIDDFPASFDVRPTV
ncbi:MAG: acylphosphatase [Myxococcales bacterium]|nr:acylphosphatase [Myxococcales bacterium]